MREYKLKPLKAVQWTGYNTGEIYEMITEYGGATYYDGYYGKCVIALDGRRVDLVLHYEDFLVHLKDQWEVYTKKEFFEIFEEMEGDTNGKN